MSATGQADNGQGSSPFDLGVTRDMRVRAIRALAAAEWTGSAFRIFNLVSTNAYFLHTLRIKLLFAGMILVNICTLMLALRRRGPFSRGREGVIFEIATSVASIVLVAALLPARTYQGRLPYQLPMANYLWPLAIMLAVYRRATTRQGFAWRAALSDFGLVVFLVPFFGLLALLNGYAWSQVRWLNLASQAAPTLVALALGYALWRVIRDFADAEVQAADNQHEAFSAWLHSELLGSLAALRRQCADGRSTMADLTKNLDSLDQAVRGGQHAITLGQQSVALADVVSHQVRRFRSVVEVDSPGMLGGWRINGEAARHLDRLLGDLFTNAVEAGAKRVSLCVERQGSLYRVTVADDGPGLPDGALARPETSLGRLVRSTAALGGKLEGARLPVGGGSQIVAYLPSRPN